MRMLMAGVCLKRDGWVISVYRKAGDKYPTLKVRRVKHAQQPLPLKVQRGGLEGVERA